MNSRKIIRNFKIRTKSIEHELLNTLEKIDYKKQNKNIESATTKTNKKSLKHSEKTQFYYRQRQIIRRKQAEQSIDEWYNLVESNYDKISYLMCAKEALIDKNEINTISKIFPLIKTFPDLVLDLVTIFPDPPLEIQQLILSKDFHSPNIRLVEEGFKYDEVNGVILDAKYRYLINMEGKLIRRYLDKRDQTSYNVKINSELFLQLSNQSRWNNIWVQIGLTLFYMDTISPSKALVNTHLQAEDTRRLGFDLITFQTIAFILKQWKMLPFQIRQTGIYDISHTMTNWNTCVVPLLYSLLELSKEEKGCNINAEFAKVMIMYRIRCAYTSFETETLDRKGIYSSLIKMITSQLNKYVRYTYDKTMTNQRLTFFNKNSERLTNSDEMHTLHKQANEKCDKMFLSTFLKYLSKLNDGTPTQNSEYCRWLSNVCLIMGNAGIYYKTSLVLEKEKSVASQTLGTLNFPKPSTYLYLNDIKIDAITNWNSGDYMYKEIEKRYKDDAKLHLDELNGNMQEWFYTLLTNKSQGFKVDVNKFADTMNINDDLLQELKNVGQVRVASFLLDNEVFGVFERYVSTMMKDGVCTIRFQNNRRARIVEIVPNVDQIGYALVLKIFEELKQNSETISVGKQIGGIVDMSLQLRITGLDHGISIFSDVSAMDAHTQPNVAVMFLKMLSELIINHNVGPITYFPFKTRECLVESTEFSSQYNNSLTRKCIPALAQTLLYIASQRLNKKYLLKDTIFNTTIEINPTIFESGRFDTSAQHTKLLKYVADTVYDIVKHRLPELSGKYHAAQRKFGDDSYECLEVVGLSNAEIDELVHEIIEITEKSLFQVGLKAETELSSYYGDFLQQMAICGVNLPKSARSSIYTDEKSALNTRDMIDLITNLANIITASAQRTYAPENVMSLVRNIWAGNRQFRLLPSKPVSITPALSKYIKQYGDATYLEYPYIMINLPPLNFPNQTYHFENLVLPASSCLRTVGGCKLNYIWNHMIPQEYIQQLFQIDPQTPIKMQIANAYEIFRQATEGTDIVESLIFFQYNRTQELSRTRYEKLQDPIIKMGKIAENYFDQNALRVSAAAAMTLKNTFGITMPDSLLYYMRPIEQLKNMFDARAETPDESIGLNDSYIATLNHNFKFVPNDVKDMIINTAIFWKPLENESVSYFNEINEFPLMPGYRLDSDYFRAMEIVGNALRSPQRQDRALVTFLTRYGKAYNFEVIHRIGTQAKLAGSSGNTLAFQLFLDAMQLPPKIRATVENMFSTNDTLLLSQLYKSGFQPEQMFAISDSLANIRTHLSFTESLAPQAKNTITVMFRDYLLLKSNRNHLHTRVAPRLPPLTFVRFGIKDFLSKIGTTVIV
uniref:RNA-dependent RNA polymerase n=3 Tax=Bobbyc reo-like virus TaxID=2716742 RepID=A0A6G7PS29_9REOV|nr:RNA-dependent RNA polymerase [Bobbyc reo-like virus]